MHEGEREHLRATWTASPRLLLGFLPAQARLRFHVSFDLSSHVFSDWFHDSPWFRFVSLRFSYVGIWGEFSGDSCFTWLQYAWFCWFSFARFETAVRLLYQYHFSGTFPYDLLQCSQSGVFSWWYGSLWSLQQRTAVQHILCNSSKTWFSFDLQYAVIVCDFDERLIFIFGVGCQTRTSGDFSCALIPGDWILLFFAVFPSRTRGVPLCCQVNPSGATASLPSRRNRKLIWYSPSRGGISRSGQEPRRRQAFPRERQHEEGQGPKTLGIRDGTYSSKGMVFFVSWLYSMICSTSGLVCPCWP